MKAAASFSLAAGFMSAVLRGVVLAWWFAAATWTGWGPIPPVAIGPFRDQQQCDHYHAELQTWGKRSGSCRCSWDDSPVPGSCRSGGPIPSSWSSPTVTTVVALPARAVGSPARSLVLRDEPGRVALVFTWPRDGYRRDGQTGANCELFRNENAAWRSSAVLLEAERYLRRIWPEVHRVFKMLADDGSGA